jgi:hypothetical protein
MRSERRAVQTANRAVTCCRRLTAPSPATNLWRPTADRSGGVTRRSKYRTAHGFSHTVRVTTRLRSVCCDSCQLVGGARQHPSPHAFFRIPLARRSGGGSAREQALAHQCPIRPFVGSALTPAFGCVSGWLVRCCTWLGSRAIGKAISAVW